MDNYHGELADILRSSPRQAVSERLISEELPQFTAADMWQFSHSNMSKDHSSHDFGNPFCTLITDPLFEVLDAPISNIIQESATIFSVDDKYSNMIQISPELPSSSSSSPHISCSTDSSRLLKPLAANHEILCYDNRRAQISSPQYTGIKRRKGEAKKVVCIRAPAPVNSRPTGEIVPSDLWAWRKYGQKPIKGSPYPRGYYRCSSSKGCSARKQVERSRTDPNMLVITYTFEHNHPWPTQRNALAGSTRNQPSKNNLVSVSNSSPGSSESRKTPLPSLDEENKEMCTNLDSSKNVNDEEIYVEEKEDRDQYSEGLLGDESYRTALADSNNHPDKDFYALELMLTQGFTVEEESESHQALDPYGLL